MSVRLAKENELERINELRRQVNQLHVKGRPETFKPGFPAELREYIRAVWNDPEQDIAVAEREGVICGFAVLHHINRPQTPYMFERDYLDIDEFCVDERFRRQGVASEMIEFIKGFAKGKGYNRIELNMWEFNKDALAFYEAAGFETYRRYMELYI